MKTHEFGIYKKKVAQLMTVAREKELADAEGSSSAPSPRERRRQEKYVIFVLSAVVLLTLAARLASRVMVFKRPMALRRKDKVALGFGQF